MVLLQNLDKNELQVLNQFLNALDKNGFNYEHDPDKFQIRVKGYIVDVEPFIIPEIKFEQNKTKRIHMNYSSEFIRVRVFDKKKPLPIDIKFPRKWYIRYEKPYLYINY